jgi:molybdopterin/thiamine biosynthesis adenylyltransferase
MLSDSELERYARHIVLREIGGTGQVKLKTANIAVVGAGGIGCPALQYLVAAGVGRITLFDDDVVSLSNLQRQILFTDADIGQPKAQVAATALARLNPGCIVTAKLIRLDTENALTELEGHDVVLDGTDSFASRLAVADAAYALKIPLVSAAIGQFHGQLATWRGWEDGKPCYRCYVGDAFDAEDCDTCAELGVLGAMTGLMGSFAAMEAIRVVTGFGDDTLGKLHLFDGLTPAMRTIRMPKDPACKTCGRG